MLTRKQTDLLHYINQRLQDDGISPSFDEMRDALGLKSKSGRIAAGTPIEALRDPDTSVHVPSAMVGRGRHYALEVAGDSMVNAGILDGDTVVIQDGPDYQPGEIVVALVDREEVTLKYMQQRGTMIALEAANPRYETRLLEPNRVQVQGRLVGLIRQY